VTRVYAALCTGHNSHGIKFTIKGFKSNVLAAVEGDEHSPEKEGMGNSDSKATIEQLKLSVGDEAFWVAASGAVPSWVLSAVKWTFLPVALMPKYVPVDDVATLQRALRTRSSSGGHFEFTFELGTEARKKIGVSHETIKERVEQLTQREGSVTLHLRLHDQDNRLLVHAPIDMVALKDTILRANKQNLLATQTQKKEEQKTPVGDAGAMTSSSEDDDEKKTIN
jgi:hypothetical protein